MKTRNKTTDFKQRLMAASLAAASLVPSDGQILRDNGGGYVNGQVLFANESRFVESFYSEPLTTYGVGWRDPSDILGTLNFIAPEVAAGRRFEFKRARNAEEFLSDSDDLRAIGSDFKRVEYSGETVNEKTYNKGLTYIADTDTVVGSGWQRQKTEKLIRRINRNELRRAFTLLSAAAVNTAKTWNSSADPDSELEAELDLGADAAGLYPNRVLFGRAAWTKRRSAYRAQNNAGGYASAALTQEQLASYLEVEKILVSKERYQSAAAAKTQIASNKVIAFYGEDGVDEEDPTHVKRFVTNFDSEQGGGRLRVYVQQISAKLVAITVEYYSNVVVTSSLGIRQFTVS